MIRAAVPADAPAICELWNWMISDTLSTFTTILKTPDDLKTLIEDRAGSTFVAEGNGTLQGFVTFGPFRSGPGYAATVEHSVIVHPSVHGRGVGRALMRMAVMAATEQSKHVMVGAISGANPQAVAFHEALGFERVGHLPQVGRKRGQWLDLILMQKMLSQGL